ncbi:hypothetical protein ACFVRD_39805 [Streptomyces sp. NPDC057908]|uniref:hypothetical protein n=1 Tax=unclassified Streptomyces TaxID=2593676 RepID=UPI002E0F1796|nr:hypothetical protein OG609_40665 [Streptomyces sp. NBC_01224]
MVRGEVEVAGACGGVFTEELRFGPQADGDNEPGVGAVRVVAQPKVERADQ